MPLGSQKPFHTLFSQSEKFLGKYKLYHILFWLIYALIIAAVIRIGNSWFDSILRQLPILATHAIVVYFNLYFLVPRFLLNRNYFSYILSALLLISAASFPISILTYSLVANQEIQGVVWSSFFLFLIGLGLLFSIILSMTLKFLKDWYDDQQSKRDLQKMQLQSELKFLKTQINPHFLFNSLNNLYALTLIKSDLAPQVVLRLSDILRYVLYETSEGKVDLQKELQHLNDFVALEQMRVGDRIKVEIDLEEPAKDYLIEPMLFLTLIENAFKHGTQSSLDEGWVRIQGKSLVEGYCLLVENAKSIEKQPSTHGGIGLDNLKKRLKYIYPDSHELTVVNDESEYRVTLSIKLHYAE